MVKVEIKRVPCPKCDGSVIKGATRCPHCKEDVDCSVVEEVVQEVEVVEEVKVQSKTSSIKKILVMIYILVAVVWGIYEYKAFGFFEDANIYARQGLDDTAQSVYRHVVDKYRFSFFVVEASENIGVKIKYPFPMFVAFGCTGALVLMLLLRLFSGGSILRVFVFGSAAAIFLAAQLVGYGAFEFDVLNELARVFMKEPKSMYIISYALILVTVGFSLGNNLKPNYDKI